ncbi:hypothetical protein PSV09DRAFT_2422791 [Bipolaris maydis]|nr:hypothetical protein PSV09DRAFT_2422791 [Bipolaris maydis]
MASRKAHTFENLLHPMSREMSFQTAGKSRSLMPRHGRSSKEDSVMFVGICLAIMAALATPMVWVWMRDRIRRRKLDPFRKLRDLEKNEKDQTLNPPPYERPPVVDSIWARQERYKTLKPARAVTADRVLGIDKASYLQRIVPQSEGSSQLLTVAPAHLGWARQRVSGTNDEEQCISPWDAEHAPNPVIFPWLQKRGAMSRSIDSESSKESLQTVALTSMSTPRTSSPSEAATRVSSDDPFLDSPIEYTGSSRNSEKSCELSDAVRDGRGESAQPCDADAPASAQSGKTAGSYDCDACQTTYSTKGQLNMHLNRKHRRRYRCQHCPSAFALKADLRRHERSVHKDMYQAQAFSCPNPACAIPQKRFARRDNLERHIRRCRNRESG